LDAKQVQVKGGEGREEKEEKLRSGNYRLIIIERQERKENQHTEEELLITVYTA
jgi:hypothetical protein